MEYEESSQKLFRIRKILWSFGGGEGRPKKARKGHKVWALNEEKMQNFVQKISIIQSANFPKQTWLTENSVSLSKVAI